MSKNGKISLTEEELPVGVLETQREVDFSDKVKERNGEKPDVRSICIDYGKETLWKAKNNKGEIYWTNSSKSPQIINVATGRGRGNLAFVNGDVGKLGGRPKGSGNKINAKAVCEQFGGHPAEMLYGLMAGDPSILRKYGIKNANDLTIKNKIDAAKELYNRMEGSAKANTLDSNGDVVSSNNDGDDEGKQYVQLYMPERGAEVQIVTSDKEREELNRLKGERATVEWVVPEGDD